MGTPSWNLQKSSLNNLLLRFPVGQINALTAATEAACVVLSVDETIKNPKVFHALSILSRIKHIVLIYRIDRNTPFKCLY